MKRQVEHEEHHEQEHRKRRILARQNAVEPYAAAVFFAFVATHNGMLHNAFDKGVTHVCERFVAVKARLCFHLDDAVLKQFFFVLIQFQTLHERFVTLDELCGAKTRADAEPTRVILDDVRGGVDAAMYRTVRAEVKHSGADLVLGGGDHLIDQLGNAFALCRADGDDRDAQLLAHAFDVHGAAVCTHFVHHVQRKHHGDAQLKKLQRQVQIALDVGRVNDVDDAVGLAVDDEISCDDLFLRIGADGVDARQVNDGAVLRAAYFAHLLIDGHAGEVADVLIGAGQRVEQRRLSAVLIACKRKDHACASVSGATRMLRASSARSVSS